MFMFGAFSPSHHSSGKSEERLQHQLMPWIEQINRRATVEINYSNGGFLAGAGEIFSGSGADWFLSETSSHNGTDMYVQAHGHPKSLPILAKMASDFAEFNQRSESIKATLRSLNTEYICVFYNANKNIVYIVSDKIGIVPAYTYRHNGNFYYATAQWILKLIDQFKDDLNWQGVAEKLYFRAPLDDRTIYKYVARLPGGAIAHISETTTISNYYKLWESYRAAAPDHVPALLAKGFDAAIVDRLNDSAVQYSTLSGGLDSRAVVSALSQHAGKINTFNFAASETLDAHLSAQYALHIGTDHHHVPSFALHYPNFSVLSRDFLDKLNTEGSQEPQAIWTGDDGSISIGFVYLRRNLLNQINALNETQAPDFVCSMSRVLPPRMFNKNRYEELRRLATDGAKQFWTALGNIDNAAKYYCFLMLNRVSRMFEEHYETAHLHRTFRCMPFLDVRTIEPVLSVDMPAGSEHRLYLDFARKLDGRILEVPWQAYPGHEPCPLPLPNAKNQWQGYDKAEKQFLRIAHRKNMVRVLTSGLWRDVVRREMLAAYVLRDWLGIEPTGGIANALHDVLNEHTFRGAMNN
jgi:hypothetical protein